MSLESDETSADLELLETYLDGELDAAQSAALKARLSGDAALAAVLADLRAQRELRAAVWRALEPDKQSAERLTWRIRGAAAEHRQEVAIKPAVAGLRWDTHRVARWGAAAAACIVIGFGLGRLGHRDQRVSMQNAPDQTPIVTNTTFAPSGYPFQAPGSSIQFNDDFAGPRPPTVANPSPTFSDDGVRLTSDEKVEQKF